jgi:hypothetical protein
MKVKNLRSIALDELEGEKQTVVINKIKSFEKRITSMEKALAELKRSYKEFLGQNIKEVEPDEFIY